jgi:hypothetical protein
VAKLPRSLASAGTFRFSLFYIPHPPRQEV